MSDGKPQMVAGRYELSERVAEGGMAVVWKARMRGAAGFSRLVAIKEIKAEYRALQKYIQMFIEEARIGTELMHPNIVQVLDFINENDSHYLVLEWVEGVDLDDFVRAFAHLKQPVPWPLALACAVGALQGLAAAHEHVAPDGKANPIVHRDISPHNILVSTGGTVKLSDFGLARARDRAFTLTAPGTMKGKLHYFSPEITLGKSATILSDQFSMGCVLWEALASKRLFTGETDVQVFKAIQSGRVPSLAELREDVPKRVVAAVHRSLRRDPAERYASAREMASELSECLREVGGGLYDANARLAKAVQVARETLQHFEPSQRFSASKMNVVTMSLQMDLDSATFGGPTLGMDDEVSDSKLK